jgi:hypothetical protein
LAHPSLSNDPIAQKLWQPANNRILGAYAGIKARYNVSEAYEPTAGN